ncbi:nucleolar complex protein 4 homolog [Lampris incognitus]|uniref:nucleolar complex protein 4 homolog n=1 Tax=Lampris incognitus TaxID=2546036 RepID=UPI0024B4BF90|nr:nucleolar complex protein 4 homolog [Lampris incognitus]
MAPVRTRDASAENAQGNKAKRAKIDVKSAADQLITSRKSANGVFDVLECLQSEKEGEVISAVSACGRLFGTFLERGDLFVGRLASEEEMLSGEHSSDGKYAIFMRHRYNSCVKMLLEHLSHDSYQVNVSSLCALMKFAEKEGLKPLEDLDWSEHYSFPRGLIQAVVERLLSKTKDNSLLISRFQEFLEMEDVRYYVMSSVREDVSKVMEKNGREILPIYQNNVFTLMSSINMPVKESELSNFMVKQEAKHEGWKAANLNDHRRAFERMWLGFLKYKLPNNMYKKILVIIHESILPHMMMPTLMMDFFTSAYEVGGAISLLALNGLFVLIHQHNLDYPDFYKKLYNLLEPSVFHVKYRARFFHLTNLFLSSSHLPLYLVAAFAKRLARLALTAPPASLLMILPFIYNLIRRHPSSRVLIHRPSTADEPCQDAYLMDEEDPALCCALESSLWEIKTLQKHYHPDVAKLAMTINTPLRQQEEDISELLETTSYELMERYLQETLPKDVPLEFDPAVVLLQGGGNVLGHHFCIK